MLKNLYIENIALIDKLDLSFGEGLNCLSGETGAGKSIIVDAFSFVLGDRADKSLIKHGKDYAFVEAVFEIKDKSVFKNFEGFFSIDNDELVLSRKMMLAGKNEVRVNGRVTSLALLKEFSSKLADIFGQSEHLNLFVKENHISVLDGFADVTDIKNELSVLGDAYGDAKKELASFGGDESERIRVIDLLNYQINEINEAVLVEGEDEELKEKLLRINNAEKIVDTLTQVGDCLNSSSGAIASILLAEHNLASLFKYDNIYEKLRARLESARYEISDIAEEVEKSLADVDTNQAEADRIEKRLDTVKLLKRKYGGSIENVLRFCEEAKSKRDILVNATERINELMTVMSKTAEKMYVLSERLSEKRQACGKKLSKLIETELRELGMKGACFEVGFNEKPSFDTYAKTCSVEGYDDVEFYMSANVGEPVKPLIKVISGGEMSRFMLAVKNITAHVERIPTMIFDEIDSGISGNIAQMVAVKLMRVSREYQCIVITHLPQIAAIADRNYLIEKYVDGDKTLSRVSLLTEEGKIKEIARLTGGNSDYAFLHGKDMVLWGNLEKEKIKRLK